MNTRRKGYTRHGVPVFLNIRGGRLSSYRIVGRPLVRRTDFQDPQDFHASAIRALSPSPRPRGLPHV